MSSEAQPASAPPAWPVLSLNERRVLGVLVEKAKTTPENYPLSLNALLTGCNQKSNRDPILNLTDLDVEEALSSAQKKGLVMRITGGRVERWRHTLYEAWHVEKVELALLAELLLRGPQTEGELRTRASRMEPIADLEALRAVLRPLAERGLVVYLSAPERRGTLLTHGFHTPKELERLRRSQEALERAEPGEAAATPAPPAAAPDQAARLVEVERQLSETRSEIAALKTTVAELRGAVAQVEEGLRQLRQALGG